MSEENRVDLGGLAFPLVEGERNHAVFGMTLCDYFAGQALMGFLASPRPRGLIHESVAIAYEYAEAMIAEKRRRERE